MGLIAHYRLDNSAEDWIGGRDGQINGEIQWVKGVLGGALDLTGGSKWVTGEGWPITGDFSYSFWAKQIEISATSNGGLVGNHWHTNGPTGVNVYFRSSLTQISIATADGETRPSYVVNLITPVTEWCHYAVTCRDGWVSVYQNGQHLDTRYRDIVQDQSRAWSIGRWTASYDSYYYEGLIDDVRIYDHALSPREVRDLSLGLVGHYPLVHDAINAGGYNSGSLHGSVVFSDIMGGSAEFDNNSYIQLETGITGDPDELSVSFWAKTDTLQTNDGLIQFDGISDHNEGFVITVANSTSMRLRYWTDGGTNITWPAGGFSSGKESHFCVTLKGNLFTVYQDGEKVGEHTYSNPLTLTGGVKLGLYTWSNNYFTGWIKDARIYATALTAAQVKEFYQQRASIDSEGNLHVN